MYVVKMNSDKSLMTTIRSTTGSGKKIKLTVDDNGNIKTEKVT